MLPPDGIELEQVRRFQPSFGCAASYAYRGSPHRSDALLPRAQRPTTRFVAFVNCEAAGLQEHRPHAASWWADLLRSSTKRLLAQVLRLGLATAKNSKGVEGRRRHAPSREGRERLCPFRPAQSRDPQGSLVGSVLASNFLQLFRIYDVPGDLAEGLGDDLKTRPLQRSLMTSHAVSYSCMAIIVILRSFQAHLHLDEVRPYDALANAAPHTTEAQGQVLAASEMSHAQ